VLSRRLPSDADVNALTRALAVRRTAGKPIVDLTESNPTRIGISYPTDLLHPLSAERALTYAPAAFGMQTAREAVARDHARRGVTLDPDRIVLTASTSEAYAWLFKLLCDAGDAVLVPRPSYPLFDHLTRLEGVTPIPFDLTYEGRWDIDFSRLRAAPQNTRAVIIVSPNNPTGSYATEPEIGRLTALCRDRGWALIADEVFADYPLEVHAPLSDIAARAEVPAFTLGGLSKTVGLPQLKLGWIVAGGPPVSCTAALAGLELIADSFLSVNTPVQLALGELLERGGGVRMQIQHRIRTNLAALRECARVFPAADVLRVEGGWSAVIRVPAVLTEEQLILWLLEEEGILVHPGYFFDFAREAFVVVSLLPDANVFRDSVTRVLRLATS
jgi:aspartate/methionine/tyrosine aminotransferase